MIKYRINGKTVSKEEWDAKKGAGLDFKSAPLGTVAYSESAPLISDGIGCMRAQVSEYREEVKRHGIRGVRILDNGQVEITSRRGRRDLLRLRGLVDNEGGYGD